LINPLLGDAPELGGTFSLSLDKLRAPLGVPRDHLAQRLEMEGKLTLHQLVTEGKNPLNQALGQLLADLHSKPMADGVRVVADAEIDFQVRDGRFYHDRLRFRFPGIAQEVTVSSRGSVGLDKTLDLHVELPRLDQALREEIGRVKAHVTGSLSIPKVLLQDAASTIRQPDRK
jgi:hypothetical protein